MKVQHLYLIYVVHEGNKFVCKNNEDRTVSNVSKSTRTIKHIRDENGKAFIN